VRKKRVGFPLGESCGCLKKFLGMSGKYDAAIRLRDTLCEQVHCRAACGEVRYRFPLPLGIIPHQNGNALLCDIRWDLIRHFSCICALALRVREDMQMKEISLGEEVACPAEVLIGFSGKAADDIR